MVSAPASSADTIGVIFRAPKTGLRTFELVECVKAISGTLFLITFLIFVHLKSACSDGAFCSIGMLISLAIYWFLD